MNTTPGRIIKRGAVRVAPANPATATGAAPAGESCHHDAAAEPKVSLHREGDIVVAIEITCGCGRTTVLECDYGEEDAG